MWSWAHLHIAINHFPIVGSVLATVFLVWALWRGQERDLRMALVFFVAIAVTGLAAYFTGDPAHHSLRGVVELNRRVVHEHEEVAETSTIILSITGLVALAGLIFTRGDRKLPRWFGPVFLLLALASSGAMALTGYRGGQIRHPEIDSGAQASPASSGEAEEPEH